MRGSRRRSEHRPGVAKVSNDSLSLKHHHLVGATLAEY